MAEEQLCNPLTERDLLENDIVYPAELPKVDHDVYPVNVVPDKVSDPIPTNVMLESKNNNSLKAAPAGLQKNRTSLPNAKSIGKSYLSITNFAPGPNKVNNFI
jgi:hypothetical protein